MLNEQLKRLRKERGVTQGALAGTLEVTQQAVAKWEAGRSTPEPGILLKLAEYFNVSVDYLFGRAGALGRVEAYSPTAPVRVVGAVRAGFGSLMYDDFLGTEPASVKDPGDYFYVVVKGDSMEPYIHDGDLALVHIQQHLNDGDLGVVMYGEGEGTLKKYRKQGDGIVLEPFNHSPETLLLKGKQIDELYIFGKVVETKTQW